MAEPVAMMVDEDGRVHSQCLHWEGFPSILWDVLRTAGYLIPPRYAGLEFAENGVTQCRVNVTIFPHPLHPEWPALEIEAVGRRLADTWELAAMRALTTFCAQRPEVVTLAPIGLFPAAQDNDPFWLNRVQHSQYLVDFHAQETIETSVRCMNALYRLLTLQSQALEQLTDLAQAYHMMADIRDEQIKELSKDLEDRDAQIGQLEGQVQEQDTLMGERDDMIAHLEEQLHDLSLELEDANEHIQWHHDQNDHPHEEDMEEDEEEPQEIDGISGMDFEGEVPQAPQMGAHSPAHSESSVNDLDDF
ncbi:uncharacterized protein C2845_PM01G44810 [Panicum miliaceum]|uniref:Uncharacterized protein n=1 Tax=Panicum miliaceum TaxID=4540 RepID=A0A3L6TNE2_PANMI|nr:uncharacterized protein C2845_PM01G44810 [Panicum miliaceum]